MKHSLGGFLTSVTFLWLTSCATQGPAVRADQVQRIQPQVTSERDIIAWFGPPTHRSVSPESTTWYYERRSSEAPSAAAAAVSDVSGILGLPVPATAQSVLNETATSGASSSASLLTVTFDRRGIVTTYEYAGR